VTQWQASGDVAIVGAGIIGLSVAFELASRGAHVRVYDTGTPASAASWAAAGMLAPRTERIADEAMQRLCESSLELYPAFADALRASSGIDPHLRLDGIMHAAYDAAAMERLRIRGHELRAGGYDAALYDREETLLAEPALSKNVTGSLLVHGEGQIDNRRLGRALVAACELRGVRICSAKSVEIECDARRVLGLRTDLGYVAAGAVINAAGAWASRVGGVPNACVPPVEPVKGQMLALQIPKGFMRHTTWVPGAYLVPRQDGRLIIGATSERAGYDSRVTAGGLERLLSAAAAAAPALRDFSIGETWAGLRPGTPDERPFLGATALEGYYLATGHYRNGILLAPVTARLLADTLQFGQPDALAPFTLERLGTKLSPA
jgi:glycine oxidase